MSASAAFPLIGEAARWAWNTSLVVALPVLLLLALGRVRRFPARARWLVGAALVLRLLLPAVPELPGAQWMPAKNLPMPVIAKTVTANDTMAGAPVDEVSTLRISGPGTAVPWRWALPVAWAVGAIAVSGWIGLSNLVIRRRILGPARECADERVHRHLRWAAQRLGMKHPPRLMVTPALPTVALSGWWRPCILVPAGLCDHFDEVEVRGIFLHELAHVRRRDVLWTWLALAASALHWFNPLVWLMMLRFRADRELECDRIALALLDEPQRRSFGEALIKTLEAHQWPAFAAVVPFAHRQPEIRTRILMITRPLTSRWIRIVAFIAAPCLVLLALANAGADGEKEPAEARDAESPTRTGAREEERPAKPRGARDGESPVKPGPGDGEGARKPGPRDGEGEAKPRGARDGEGGRRAEGEADGARKEKEAREGEKAGSGNPVVLRVVEKGESVSVDGEVLPLKRLRGFLSEYLPAHPGRKVFIEADDDVPYKSVAETLDAARDNGAKNATLRTARR